MRSKSTVAFATRLPSSEADQLEEVKEETDWTDAALVRRALRYYVHENPDRISVLYSEDSINEFMAELLE
mgnify:CR=1 FL=1